jgi:hypothetical protein
VVVTPYSVRPFVNTKQPPLEDELLIPSPSSAIKAMHLRAEQIIDRGKKTGWRATMLTTYIKQAHNSPTNRAAAGNSHEK